MWIRWTCLVAALGCFTWGAATWFEQRQHQQEAQESFEEMIKQPAQKSLKKRNTRPIARLQIARLKVAGYVEDGFDDRTLNRAIGHSPYSASPGQPGNIVLAAHRDTFFAGLQYVRMGDVVDIQAADGKKYHYRVTRVLVVNPNDNW